ncbi:hypothetical protein P691DRAFT_487865 [Macrolepiota fuliginosa MF-IS2]|uniref:Uncharacterized protein n=1 Tax=Macrolepiota fuliginosa MF-IS2 TaxID=1400762 RepID=A0A9P5XNN2_9AGAR|nr:hypothetical protein P691DRAFT_487865 [Macrolepiota fuliginosa MF-IS2]
MTQEKIAKVHVHHSQRAKARDGGDRKVAFKGVLDNPHRVSWPPVSANVQNSILAQLMEILDGVAEYHGKCCTNTRKRKRLSEVKDDSQPHNTKKRATSRNLPDIDRDLPSEARVDHLVLPDTAEGSEPPSILKSLVCGINAVTKQLEAQIEKCRAKMVLQIANNSRITEERNAMIKYLFVCRGDVDPSILVDHLPHLVAIYNVLRRPDLPPITLIPLPKGAETILAQAMGVRRLAAFAIDVIFNSSKELGD